MASPAGIPPPPGPGEDDYTVPKFAKMPEVVTATQVATQFAQAYYAAFATDPASCSQFYQAASVLTFEGANSAGLNLINAKLAEVKTQLPPGSKHEVLSIDGQPSCAVNGGVVVYVTCRFMERFAQEVFHLLPNAGSFYVHNDIFRLGQNNQMNTADDQGGKVAQAFLQHYVTAFDSNRASLVSLFRPNSVMTFEGQVFVGAPWIAWKLQQVPPVKHNQTSFTVDSQSVNGEDIILVNLSGELLLDEKPFKFTEMFQLVKSEGGYFVGNMVYRLNYG